jgi:hypothetical protein
MINYGCDPEFFFATEINGEKFVISPALLNKFSSLKFISGDEKHPVFFENEQFKWMMDGVAAEITIKKPYKNPVAMFGVIQDAYDKLNEISSKLSFHEFKVFPVREPVININPDWYIPFLNDRQIYQGFIYGCDADFDADNKNYVCVTTDASKDLFRYGGGHHHVSGDDLFYDYIFPAIKLSAIFVGTFCIANSPHPEMEVQRGKVYGRPARFRPQNYPDGTNGMEYRTPSNSWTGFNISTVEEMFSKYNIVKKLLHYEEKAVEVLDNFYKKSALAIVSGDVNSCIEIQKEISVFGE